MNSYIKLTILAMVASSLVATEGGRRKPSLEERFAPKDHFTKEDLDLYERHFLSEDGRTKNGAGYNEEADMYYRGSPEVKFIRDSNKIKLEYDDGYKAGMENILFDDMQKEACKKYINNNIKKIIFPPDADKYFVNNAIPLTMEKYKIRSRIQYSGIFLKEDKVKSFGQIIGILEKNNMLDLQVEVGDKKYTFLELKEFLFFTFDDSDSTNYLNRQLEIRKTNEAAKIIQKNYKGYKARKEFKGLKEEASARKEEAAAEQKVDEIFAGVFD